MKKYLVVTLLALQGFQSQAHGYYRGHYGYGPYSHGYHHYHGGSSFGLGVVTGGLLFGGARDVYYEPAYCSSPGYGYYTSSQPSYALPGAVLGGVAGGIIGNNSGHHTLEGAAIGAGAGLLLGAIADHSARRRVIYPQPVYLQQPSTVQEASPAQSSQVTVINNYPAPQPAGAMSAANGLFGR